MSMYGTVGGFRAITPMDTSIPVSRAAYNFAKARELFAADKHDRLERLLMKLYNEGNHKLAEAIIDNLD